MDTRDDLFRSSKEDSEALRHEDKLDQVRPVFPYTLSQDEKRALLKEAEDEAKREAEFEEWKRKVEWNRAEEKRAAEQAPKPKFGWSADA